MLYSDFCCVCSSAGRTSSNRGGHPAARINDFESEKQCRGPKEGATSRSLRIVVQAIVNGKGGGAGSAAEIVGPHKNEFRICVDDIAEIPIDDLPERFLIFHRSEQGAVYKHDTGAGKVDDIGDGNPNAVDRAVKDPADHLVPGSLG